MAQLANYNFEIQHKSGKKNIDAGRLSKVQWPEVVPRLPSLGWPLTEKRGHWSCCESGITGPAWQLLQQIMLLLVVGFSRYAVAYHTNNQTARTMARVLFDNFVACKD